MVSDNQSFEFVSNKIEEDSEWYSEGLRFKCTGCGKCCTGSTGYVWVSVEEIVAMADYLKLSVDSFVKRYIRQVDGRYSLKEHVTRHDCLFLDGKQCKIYPVRPKQCREFPWWIKNLESPEAWQKAAEYCEGINHKDAPLVQLRTIKENLASN